MVTGIAVGTVAGAIGSWPTLMSNRSSHIRDKKQRTDITAVADEADLALRPLLILIDALFSSCLSRARHADSAPWFPLARSDGRWHCRL
jgi:hypothetical protein